MKAAGRRAVSLLTILTVAGIAAGRGPVAMAQPAPAADPAAVPAGAARLRGREVAGAILAVGALATGGVGLYLSARVDRLERDIEQAKALETPVPREQIDQKTKAGERAEVVQWVAYGAAVAMGVGSALLLLWPEREANGAAAGPRVQPLLGPALAGAAFRLAF